MLFHNELPPTAARMRALLGRSPHNGEAVWLDLEPRISSVSEGQGPHGLLVAGPESHGADLWRSILRSLAAQQSADSLHLWMVNAGKTLPPHVAEAMAARLVVELPTSDLSVLTDGLTTERREYEQTLLVTALPHVREVLIGPDPKATADRLNELVHGEIERRTKVLADAHARDRHDYLWQRHRDGGSRRHPVGELPALLIFIDAFPMLLHPDQSLGAATLNQLHRYGRALGIYVLLAAGTLGPLAALQAGRLATYRIAMRTSTPDDSREVLGVADAYALADPRLGYLRDLRSESLTQFVLPASPSTETG